MSNANHSYEFEKFVSQQHEKLTEILKGTGEGEDYWKHRSKRVEEIATNLANYNWRRSFEDARLAPVTSPSQYQQLSAPVSQGLQREELEEVVTIAMPASILARRRTTGRPDSLAGSLEQSPAGSLHSSAALENAAPKTEANKPNVSPVRSVSGASQQPTSSGGASPRTPRLPTPPPVPSTVHSAGAGTQSPSHSGVAPLPSSPRKISRSYGGNANSNASISTTTVNASSASSASSTPLAESNNSTSSSSMAGGVKANPLALPPQVADETKKPHTSPRDDKTPPTNATSTHAATSNAPSMTTTTSLPIPKDQGTVSSTGGDSASSNASGSTLASTPSATALLTSKSKLAVKRRPSAEEKSAKITSLKNAMQSQSSTTVLVTSPRSMAPPTTAPTGPFSPPEGTEDGSQLSANANPSVAGSPSSVALAREGGVEKLQERDGAMSPSTSESNLSSASSGERDRMRKTNSIVEKKKKPSEALTSGKSDSKETKPVKKDEKELLAVNIKSSKDAKDSKDKSSERSPRGESSSQSGLAASPGSGNSASNASQQAALLVPPVDTSRAHGGSGGATSPMRTSSDGNDVADGTNKHGSDARARLSPRSLIDVIERGGDASDAAEEFFNKPLTQLDSRRCLRRQEISRQQSNRVSIMSNRVFEITDGDTQQSPTPVSVPLGLTVTLFDEPQTVANSNARLFHGEKVQDSSVTTTASSTVTNDNATQTTNITTTVNTNASNNTKVTTTTTETSTITSAVVSDRKAMKRAQSQGTKAPRSPMRKMLSTNDLQLTSSGGGSPVRSASQSNGSREIEKDAISGLDRMLSMNATDDPARVRRFQKLLAAEGGKGVNHNHDSESMSARIIGSEGSSSLKGPGGRERKTSQGTPPQSPRHAGDITTSTSNLIRIPPRANRELDEAMKLKRKTRISFTTDDLKVVKTLFADANDGGPSGPGLTLQQKQANRKSFLFASSSPSISEASALENLPPVIDPSVQAIESSAAFVIEEGGKLGEMVALELIDIPDYYADLFMGSKHFNWISVHQSKPKFPYFISVSATPANGFFAGLITDRKGTKYSVTFIPISKKGMTMQSNADYVEKWLVKTFPQNTFLRFGKDIESMRAIASIEKNFRQELKEFQIALVPCKEGQTNPLDMFLTQEHSASYEKFLKSMEYRDYINGEYLIWHEKKVRYLSTTKLNSEQHRRLVGNTQVVIFFMDSANTSYSSQTASSSFMLTDIDKMGIVPQFFFVVKPFGANKYRIGFFNRINLQVSVEPLIPREPIDSITIKDFLLTKIYNAYMLGRSVPPINRLYESPKQQAINELVFKYASNAWIKKFCELERDDLKNLS